MSKAQRTVCEGREPTWPRPTFVSYPPPFVFSGSRVVPRTVIMRSPCKISLHRSTLPSRNCVDCKGLSCRGFTHQFLSRMRFAALSFLRSISKQYNY